ncbi:MAG: glycoside-pentoside-hexuronide (GPH):cation symporter [Eubacteriales bacterium]|nr:glycoside-pentoside-hexuronide (GPH):cation symporter [Eubacteriales bacterium]
MKGKAKAKANWLDPSTAADNEILPKYLKWAWTSRGLSLALNVILIMQLTYYCTDMLGMPALGVGTLLLASKLFDGVTDLLIGFVIDRTHTRFGKARPYEISIVFVWLLTVLLFSVPSSMGLGAKYVYIFILYTLINSVFATALNGGDAVYLARAVRSEKNRVSIMSFNGAIIMLFSIVISIVMPQLIAGIGATKEGWTVIAVVFAVPLVVIGMLRFVFVKEVAIPDTAREAKKSGAEQSLPLRTSLRCLVQNKYIFLISGMTLCVQLISNIGSSVNTYYFKYIVGDIGLASLVSMSSMITPLVMVFFPVLSRKLGMVRLLKVGMVIGVIGYALRIAGGTNLATLTVGSLLSGVAILPITMMISIYLIDCMDYGEWKTGIRIEGILASVNSFSSKLGSGIASSLVGIIMGMAGYDGALEVQSAAANVSIVALFNYLPMVLVVVTLILAFLYRLDQQMPQIKADLEAKRARG